MTRTYRLMIAATILLIIGSLHEARAQVSPPCLPGLPGTPSALQSGITKNGAWVRWRCYTLTTVTTIEYVGTLPELSKVGARLQTIIKAADPLQSLRTAGSRFTMLPLTDPSLALIVADMRAVP